MEIEILLSIIFGVLAILAIFEEEDYMDYKPYLYWGICIMLIVVAGFREIGSDHDSLNYQYTYMYGSSMNMEIVSEISFTWICNFFNALRLDVRFFFLFYAILGVTLKFIAFRRLSSLYFIPAFTYFSYYFMLHDMTQIRAGIASAMILFAIKPIQEGNRLKALAYLLIALFFHYSSAIVLPLVFLSNKDLDGKRIILWASIVPATYFLYFIHFNIITSIPLPMFSDKIELYQTMKDKGLMGEDINVFNVFHLFRVFIYLYALYFYETIKAFNPYITILLKIMGISIASLVIFSALPVFAFRVSELFGIVDIIIITSIYYTLKPSYFSKFVIVVMNAAIFLLSIVYNGLFDPTKAPDI